MTQVRATENGFDGICMRTPDDADPFEWPDTVMVKDPKTGKLVEEPNPIPPWCEVVEPVETKAKAKDKGKSPDSLA